jgi:pilus assembly protein CpaC
LRNRSKNFWIDLAFVSSLSIGAVYILSTSTVVAQEGSPSRELFLVKDMPQTITVEYDIGEIALGNPAIVSVVADRGKRRIVLSPLEPGETALLVFDTTGAKKENIQITVTSTDLDTFVKDLKFLFRDIEGLQFRRVGSKVIIEGEVYLRGDLDRIHEVLKGNQFVVDLVTLSQDTQRILARRIKDEINIAGVEVGTAKDRIVLKGEVASEEDAARAEKIAAIYAEKASIVNVIAVNPKKASARGGKLVQITAYFVELNKAFLRNFNFSWTPIASTQFTWSNAPKSQGGGFNLLAVVTEFLPKLNTAKALGVARVFENPTVSVKSGDQASIRSGGQINVPVIGDKGQVTFSPINTGVTLTTTPSVDDREFIDMKVNVEVSKLGSTTTAQAVVVNQSSVQTSHYVRSGETVVIGGVLRSAFSDIKDSPPNQPFSFSPAEGVNFTNSFGNIFQIFKSRDTQSERTMFIVFITPEVLNSARDSGRSIRERMNINGIEARSPSAGEDFE